MPFADTTQMLHAAQAGGYAVGAFNAENMEMAQAIVLAAQEARAGNPADNALDAPVRRPTAILE